MTQGVYQGVKKLSSPQTGILSLKVDHHRQIS